MILRHPRSTLFPSTTLCRSKALEMGQAERKWVRAIGTFGNVARMLVILVIGVLLIVAARHHDPGQAVGRSEEHTSELQSRQYLVCRLLLEKKKSYRHPSSAV